MYLVVKTAELIFRMDVHEYYPWVQVTGGAVFAEYMYFFHSQGRTISRSPGPRSVFTETDTGGL